MEVMQARLRFLPMMEQPDLILIDSDPSLSGILCQVGPLLQSGVKLLSATYGAFAAATQGRTRHAPSKQKLRDFCVRSKGGSACASFCQLRSVFYTFPQH